jgi:hypothetical protein
MGSRILLINPWIYDFAAYNLWSRPLGLLKVAENLSSFDVELSLIDCVDASERKKFGSGKFVSEAVNKPPALKNVPRLYKRYGIAVDELAEKARKSLPVDMVFMTSIMSHWFRGCERRWRSPVRKFCVIAAFDARDGRIVSLC